MSKSSRNTEAVNSPNPPRVQRNKKVVMSCPSPQKVRHGALFGCPVHGLEGAGQVWVLVM